MAVQAARAVQAGGVVVKQARIAAGVIVNADRQVHVTRNPAHGGPDAVQWMRVPGDTRQYRIRFDKPEGSPFDTNVFDVPPSAPHVVRTDAQGNYRYSVYEIASTGWSS